MQNDYPAARFLARSGKSVAAAAGIGICALGVWSVLDGAPYWVGAASIAAGAVSYLLLRSYCELVRILLDILLPQ